MNKVAAKILTAWIPSRTWRRSLRARLIGKKNEQEEGYDICGIGNRVLVVENGVEVDYTHRQIPGLTIHIRGNNNLIYIPDKENFLFNNVVNLVSDNAVIRFGKSDEDFRRKATYWKQYAGYRNLYIGTSNGNNQRVEIGDNLEISGASVLMGESDCHFIMGDYCMCSNNVTFQVSDAHSVLDRERKNVLNRVKKALIIGSHCWINRHAIFTKNACIAPHTIVGVAALVTKSFNEEYVAIGGNPARIIKRDVDWSHESPSAWEKEHS